MRRVGAGKSRPTPPRPHAAATPRSRWAPGRLPRRSASTRVPTRWGAGARARVEHAAARLAAGWGAGAQRACAVGSSSTRQHNAPTHITCCRRQTDGRGWPARSHAARGAAAQLQAGQAGTPSLPGRAPARPPACAAHPQPHVFDRPQITRGLLQKYGAERVKDTPITEVRPGQALARGGQAHTRGSGRTRTHKPPTPHPLTGPPSPSSQGHPRARHGSATPPCSHLALWGHPDPCHCPCLAPPPCRRVSRALPSAARLLAPGRSASS